MESKKLNNPILKQLLFEKNNNVKGGLYQRTLIKFLDNRHSRDEVINIGKCFCFLLDTIDKVLDQDIILTIHKILKTNTKYSKIDGDGYKKYQNYLWKDNLIRIETVQPRNVENEMKCLLSWYTQLPQVTLTDLSNFLMYFFLIHPFQDGNGRVGRFMMFRECLRNNIMPFIIENEYHDEYLKGIVDQQRSCDQNSIVETFKKCQINYSKLVKDLTDIKTN